MRVHYRHVYGCATLDWKVLTRHPLPPGVGGPLTVQGVKRLIKFEWQDVHDTHINQLSTQKGDRVPTILLQIVSIKGALE